MELPCPAVGHLPRRGAELRVTPCPSSPPHCILRDPPTVGHGCPGAAAPRSHGQTGLAQHRPQERVALANAECQDWGCPGSTCSALTPGHKGSHCAGNATPPPAEPRPPWGFAQQKPQPCQSQHRLLPLREEAEWSSEPLPRPERKPPPASSDAVALGVFASSPPSFESALSAAHWEQKPPQAPPRKATEFPFGPTLDPTRSQVTLDAASVVPAREWSAGAPSQTGRGSNGGTGSCWPPASRTSGQMRSGANECCSLGPAHWGCRRGQGRTSAAFWLWCSTCHAAPGCGGRTYGPSRGCKPRSIALTTSPRCCLL